jgi:hypothetical protein
MVPFRAQLNHDPTIVVDEIAWKVVRRRRVHATEGGTYTESAGDLLESRVAML